jgi:hypothetical protein
MKTSETAKALALGFRIAGENFRNSGGQFKMPLRDQFVSESLAAHLITDCEQTISAFKEGYEQGWSHAERKAAK